MLRLLRQPRWWRAAALTAVVSVVCCLLGLWQWDRRETRLERIQRVEANYAADPVPAADVLPGPGDVLPGAAEWTPVTVRGEYAPESTVLVRNRPQPGTQRYGYLVLVPLRLPDGGTLVLERGWVPNGPTGEAPAALPPPPSGPVTVVARLRPPEPADERGAPAGQVQSIDLDGAVRAELAREGQGVATDLVAGAYGVLVSEDPAPTTAPELASPPSTEEGPHLAYTVQWFVFAAGVWAFFVVQLRRRAREDAPTAPRPTPARTRRPSDEESEDALLDAASRRD